MALHPIGPVSGRDLPVFLVLLLSADILYVALHALHSFHDVDPVRSALAAIGKPEFFADPLYAIDQERGFAEAFQYMKFFWAGVMMLWVFRFRHQLLPLFWALLFMYLLMDDSMALHERIGNWLVREYDYTPMLGLRAQDIGELTVVAVFGSGFLILGLAAYLMSDSEARRTSLVLAGFLAALAFFGIVIDMSMIIIETADGSFLGEALEDGGEMMALSVVCWYVYKLLLRSGGSEEFRFAQAALSAPGPMRSPTGTAPTTIARGRER